jgi:tetratricopeptide (TPR) repeat protein
VPGWHKQVSDLVKNGDVQMVGIIQEQHPDRCRLFAQWQGFEWPILNDAINVLPTRAVPVVIAIDEHGVVQSTRPRPDWVRNEFIKTDYPKPDETARTTDSDYVPYFSAKQLKNPTESLLSARGTLIWGAAAYQQTKAGSPEQTKSAEYFNKAIALYDGVIKEEPENAMAHFGRGVALRMRYESPLRQNGDFQAAVNAWGKALDIDPNHYIYRRRIQQYGPRLTKPYPFYDWVPKARADIKARGDEPVQLAVEPGGAEIASPDRSFKTAEAATNPDPKARINTDKNGLVEISSVTVPARVKPGQTTRIHLTLRTSGKAHWNNEAEPVQVWIDQPDGWQLQKNLFTLDQPKKPESTEARKVELEAKLSANSESTRIKGYALFYVCEEADGTCLYLRRDFEIPIVVQ